MAGPATPPVVLSVEQALSMSYATLRMVHQGWRVIRLEPTPVKGRASRGDPNRSIGRPVTADGRHSYFVAPNVGKQAIAVDLKQERGRELLRRLLRELPVDVFCTNTLPRHHERLGIDDATLRAVRPDLIWCGISAMGTAHPDVPGYDPVLQALCGYMDLTGHADGPPLQCGPPLTDLKAGDEAFTQVVLAMLERERTGHGKRIDLSMAQLAVSWLHTFTPMLDMGSPPTELRRSGNEHRQFIPVNAYRCSDGFVYVAVGSDAQWGRLVRQPMFAALDQERWASNEGRRASKGELHAAIEAVTGAHTAAEVSAVLTGVSIPHAPITPIEQVPELPFVKAAALSTVTPDDRTVRLPPPAVSTPFLEQLEGRLPFAPAYGEHTDAILAEVGCTPDEVTALREGDVVA
jgi:crotonobetainyl-CoA:carnitine CoA-transferase CaiB-like acyl-CoA transferase